MIKTINAWRGLFAVSIALYHFNVRFIVQEQLVWAGVVFFFAAGGFLHMEHHGHMAATWPQWRAFMRKRAAGIYPMHWLALVLVMWAQAHFLHRGVDGVTLTLNALLLHPWVPVRSVYLSFNGPAWFLGALLWCYALAPLLARVFNRMNAATAMAATAVWWTAMAVTRATASTALGDFMHFCPLVRMGDFMMGMALHRVFTALRQRRQWHRHAFALEAGVVAAVAASWTLNMVCPPARVLNESLLWWPSMGLLIVVAALLHGHESPLGKILLIKPLQWLGKYSYEIYLFQMVAAGLFGFILFTIGAHYGVNLRGEGWACFAILLLLAPPLQRLNKWIKKRLAA